MLGRPGVTRVGAAYPLRCFVGKLSMTAAARLTVRVPKEAETVVRERSVPSIDGPLRWQDVDWGGRVCQKE